MKLTTEKILDILPSVVDIMEKLKLKKFSNNKALQKMNEQQVGYELFKLVAKNTPKIKTELFTIISIVEEKTVEEVAKSSPAETLNTIKELMGDKEVMAFFKGAME
jgi:hypothetical protein